MAANGPKVVEASCREIVNDHNLFAIRQQPFDQVRADEAGAAGDQNMFSGV
jgi:hypothetical protein